MNSYDKKRCISFLVSDSPFDPIEDKSNELYFIIPFPDWNNKEFLDPFFQVFVYNFDLEDVIIKESICDLDHMKNYKDELKISIYRDFDPQDDFFHIIIEIFKLNSREIYESVFVDVLERGKPLSEFIKFFGRYYYFYNGRGEIMMKNTFNQKITLFHLLYLKMAHTI